MSEINIPPKRDFDMSWYQGLPLAPSEKQGFSEAELLRHVLRRAVDALEKAHGLLDAIAWQEQGTADLSTRASSAFRDLAAALKWTASPPPERATEAPEPQADDEQQKARTVACSWCGRSIYEADGRWLATKGKERGYDPLLCDANDDGAHEPAVEGSSTADGGDEGV